MEKRETEGKANEVTNAYINEINVIDGTVGNSKANGDGVAVNRNYKDTVFCMIFKDKKAALELYNAVNSTDYDNPDELEIVTLENAIYMSVKNDVAMIIDYRLAMYEHQSTICPNMPLRSLVYVTTELEKLLVDANLYAKKLVKIPTPSFVVFYNGIEKYPESQVLRLSDAFEMKTDDPQLELKVKVFNINKGYNEALKGKSRNLSDYMIYVDKVRDYAKVMPLREAVKKAVDECIEEDVLKELLLKNKVEVVRMSIFEYDEEDTMRIMREVEYENGVEYGMERGREEGRDGILLELIGKKLSKGKTVSVIASELEIAKEVINDIIAKHNLLTIKD